MVEPMIKQFANPSPMPVGEPRTRDERITDERRANHGRETNEPRTRDERTTDERRTFLAPCALTLLRTRP